MKPWLQRWPAVIARGALVGWLGVVGAHAAASRPVQARKVTLPIYAPGESNAVAVLRADRVAREHRRLGFFRVQLLPLLVVEGARLELGRAGLNSNLLAHVQAGLEPLAGRVPFELRDFTVLFPEETAPRLTARRVRPDPSLSAAAWLLDSVTMQSGGQAVTLPRARLRFEGEPGRMVWQTKDAVFEWNLFTGTFTTNQLTVAFGKATQPGNTK